MKRLLLILTLLTAASTSVLGQKDTLEFSETYLDTVQIPVNKVINDYSMIGISYGVNFCGQNFNPEFQQKWNFYPGYFSLTFSHYEKLFDYLPYFGFSVGLAYAKEGFEFATDKTTGEPVRTMRGAYKCSVDLAEIPFLIEGHYDAEKVRLLMNLGPYAGYRFNMVREGQVEEALKNGFDDTDIRFDFGLIAGLGIGYVLEPFEFHLKGQFRFSWQNMVKPDYLDQYKYYFASPMGVTVQVGVYYHLTRRRGKTNAELKRQARDIVYGTREQ
ncbi:MAG: PorT family protein [Bacteroidales bacterium]|nr:PorT family protein [Bacteroidales bacterium]